MTLNILWEDLTRMCWEDIAWGKRANRVSVLEITPITAAKILCSCDGKHPLGKFQAFEDRILLVGKESATCSILYRALV